MIEFIWGLKLNHLQEGFIFWGQLLNFQIYLPFSTVHDGSYSLPMYLEVRITTTHKIVFNQSCCDEKTSNASTAATIYTCRLKSCLNTP